MFYSIRRITKGIRIWISGENILEASPGKPAGIRRRMIAEVLLQIILTISTGTIAIYILLKEDSDNTQRELAAGWFGIILGYWFR
jgi:hypothetical protein